MPGRRPPRLLRSIKLAVAPPDDDEEGEIIGVMTLDSDRGEVEYLLTTDSALAIRTKMQEFLDISTGTFAGLSTPQEGQTQTAPISPASITVGDTEMDGRKVGVLQIKSADGREASLLLDEGQAEFIIQAAAQLQALLNQTRQ